MTTELLTTFSNTLADTVAAAAPAVVQVQGRRRPVSGLVYADNIVVTMARALGREDGVRVRRHDGHMLDAEVAGWDPTTGLAVLRVSGLETRSLTPAAAPARVGHVALAIARSWSNAVTASAGIVSVIGGPLATGRRRAIDHVLRTTAPMHDGFAGGAFVDTTGALLGVTTAAAIRGLGVVIPASIAGRPRPASSSTAASSAVTSASPARRARLAAHQRDAIGRDEALVVVGVPAGSPAAAAGVLVGDVLFEFDGHAIGSPEHLLDLLTGERVGRQATLRLLRGGAVVELGVTIGERPAD